MAVYHALLDLATMLCPCDTTPNWCSAAKNYLTEAFALAESLSLDNKMYVLRVVQSIAMHLCDEKLYAPTATMLKLLLSLLDSSASASDVIQNDRHELRASSCVALVYAYAELLDFVSAKEYINQLETMPIPAEKLFLVQIAKFFVFCKLESWDRVTEFFTAIVSTSKNCAIAEQAMNVVCGNAVSAIPLIVLKKCYNIMEETFSRFCYF